MSVYRVPSPRAESWTRGLSERAKGCTVLARVTPDQKQSSAQILVGDTLTYGVQVADMCQNLHKVHPVTSGFAARLGAIMHPTT